LRKYNIFLKHVLVPSSQNLKVHGHWPVSEIHRILKNLLKKLWKLCVYYDRSSTPWL